MPGAAAKLGGIAAAGTGVAVAAYLGVARRLPAARLILRPEYGGRFGGQSCLVWQGIGGLFARHRTWPIGGLSWPVSTVIAIVYIAVAIARIRSVCPGHLRSGWLMGLLTIAATVLAFVHSRGDQHPFGKSGCYRGRYLAGALGYLAWQGPVRGRCSTLAMDRFLQCSWVESRFLLASSPSRPLLLASCLLPALALGRKPFRSTHDWIDWRVGVMALKLTGF